MMKLDQPVPWGRLLLAGVCALALGACTTTNPNGPQTSGVGAVGGAVIGTAIASEVCPHYVPDPFGKLVCIAVVGVASAFAGDGIERAFFMFDQPAQAQSAYTMVPANVAPPAQPAYPTTPSYAGQQAYRLESDGRGGYVATSNSDPRDVWVYPPVAGFSTDYCTRLDKQDRVWSRPESFVDCLVVNDNAYRG